MGVFGVTHGSHVVSSVTNWYPSLMSWKNRIVEQRSMPVGELVAHPSNWRKHPKAQHAALAGLLGEVGVAPPWLGSVKTTGSFPVACCATVDHDHLGVISIMDSPTSNPRDRRKR